MTLLPKRLRPQMHSYVEHGQPPGVFLAALLIGKPELAAQHIPYDPAADGISEAVFERVRKFIDRFVPRLAHGSEARLNGWIAAGGLHGKRRDAGFGPGNWENAADESTDDDD